MPKAKSHILNPDQSRRPRNDLTGIKIHRWTVISFAGRERSVAYWNCRCQCGIEQIVQAQNLTAGKTKSKYRIPYYTLRSRLKLGWTIDDAIETPPMATGRYAKRIIERLRTHQTNEE